MAPEATLGKTVSCVASLVRYCLPCPFRRRWLKPTNFWTWDIEAMSGELPDFRVSLRRIRASGYSPSLIIDVGAWQGEWSEMARSVWPESEFLMVEALEEKARGLTERLSGLRGSRVVNAVLSARSGETREFQVMGTGSSLYPELSGQARRGRRVVTKTLDEVVDAASLHRMSTLLKLDVQGTELEILGGATQALECAQWLVLEVSLVSMNVGAPLFHEVIARCREFGFVVSDIAGTHRDPRTTQLQQIDVIFRRDASVLS